MSMSVNEFFEFFLEFVLLQYALLFIFKWITPPPSEVGHIPIRPMWLFV